MFEIEEKSRFRIFLQKHTFAVSAAVVVLLLVALGAIVAIKKKRSGSRKAEITGYQEFKPDTAKSRTGPTLAIGFMPSSNVEQVHQLSSAIASRMSQTENFEVRSVVGTSYGDLADAVRDGDVDAVFLSPVLYVKNDFHKTHRPLLRVVRKGPNPDAYFGAFVVKNSSKHLRSLGDVCNVTVGYTDLDSSSGYVYPKLMLLKHLKKTNRLNRCKIREVFLDGHKGVLDAVAAGDVDVGATFANDTHGKFGAWKQLGAYSVRAIAVTDAIPSDGLFVPKTMSPAMQKKISSAFRELLETEDGKVMLEKLFRAQKLVPTKDADYDGVVSVVSQFRAMTGTFR